MGCGTPPGAPAQRWRRYCRSSSNRRDLMLGFPIPSVLGPTALGITVSLVTRPSPESEYFSTSTSRNTRDGEVLGQRSTQG